MRVLMIEGNHLYAATIRDLWKARMPDSLFVIGLKAYQGLEYCQNYYPDIIILDLDMPDADGLSLVPELRKMAPNAKIVGFAKPCGRVRQGLISLAHLAGKLDRDHLCAGSIVTLSTMILDGRKGVGAFFPKPPEDVIDAGREFASSLSDRELQLLGDLGAGLDNEELATKYELSPRTIRNHRRSIMSKLGLHTSTALMRFAIENGFSRVNRLGLLEATPLKVQ